MFREFFSAVNLFIAGFLASLYLGLFYVSSTPCLAPSIPASLPVEPGAVRIDLSTAETVLFAFDKRIYLLLTCPSKLLCLPVSID